MASRYAATRFSVIFYAWALGVTGTITWLSGDPNPVVGTAIAGVLFIQTMAFIDWELGK